MSHPEMEIVLLDAQGRVEDVYVCAGRRSWWFNHARGKARQLAGAVLVGTYAPYGGFGHRCGYGVPAQLPEPEPAFDDEFS
jgi:hypothetical protein